MGGPIQNIPETVPAKTPGNLPVQAPKKRQHPAHPYKVEEAPIQALPNATIIYGIGASLLFVASFSLLLAGNWFSALWVLASGLCLVGFALHLLKHQD